MLPSRRPTLVDVGVTAFVELIATLPLVHRGHHSIWAWLLSQGLVLPLLVRRRWPSGVFTAIATVALVQWLTGERLVADVALLVALYTVVTREPRRRALIAAATLELGVILAAVRFAPTGDGIIGSIVFLSGLVVAATLFGTAVQNRRTQLALLVDRADRLEREREQQDRLAATAERTRIAREMHDIVAHSLSVMVTLADGAALTNAQGADEATEAMRSVSATGRQALAEMRKLLGVLRDDAASLDLEPQPGLDRIESLLGRVRAAGLPVRLTVSGTRRPLPATVDTTAYRVVQESLTNTLKHAREPTTVHVRLDWTADALVVDVTDDGRVHTVPEPDSGPRLGLAGMRERVALFAGTLSAGPGNSGGWRVHAVLPTAGS
jgi:signal transduction histidine kinase